MARPQVTITRTKNGAETIRIPAFAETPFEEARRRFQEAFRAATEGKTTLTLADVAKLAEAVNTVHVDVYAISPKEWAKKPSELRPKNPNRR